MLSVRVPRAMPLRQRTGAATERAKRRARARRCCCCAFDPRARDIHDLFFHADCPYMRGPRDGARVVRGARAAMRACVYASAQRVIISVRARCVYASRKAASATMAVGTPRDASSSAMMMLAELMPAMPCRRGMNSAHDLFSTVVLLQNFNQPDIMSPTATIEHNRIRSPILLSSFIYHHTIA